MTHTTKQVAEFLGLSPDTVRAMILAGRLKALNLAQPGKRAQYRITAEQLAEFQARCVVVKIEKTRRTRTDAIPFRRYG